MKPTTLNLQAPAPTERKRALPNDCPTCGAPEKKRIEAGGFGRHKLTVCGECGYEFPQS